VIDMNTKEASIKCDYKIYNDDNELSSSDQDLINQASLIAHKAYAPYSGFKVGAVAQMKNGSIINGTNQENASYPIGLCAERVLLAAVSSLAIDQPITTMAISYQTSLVDANKPVAPCGICRQSLVEFENRYGAPMRLLISGAAGEVYEFSSVSMLLPFSFKAGNLGK